MKSAEAMLDLANNKVRINGVWTDLIVSSSSHYRMWMLPKRETATMIGRLGTKEEMLEVARVEIDARHDNMPTVTRQEEHVCEQIGTEEEKGILTKRERGKSKTICITASNDEEQERYIRKRTAKVTKSKERKC